MIPLHLLVALVSAGVALFAGLVSLFTGLHKEGEKVDVIFGCLCISICLFFILPPTGFIVLDQPPYSDDLLFKRVFGAIYYCLFSWFINSYTGYKRRTFPLVINGMFLITYLLMWFTGPTDHPLWLIIMILAVAIIIVHGFTAVRYQFKNGDRNRAIWFQAAILIFLALFLLSAINQVRTDYFVKPAHRQNSWFINLFPLLFITIMGIRLRANSIQKLKLENELRSKNRQWESVMQHMQLIVVHTDLQGKLQYINPFGINLLQYKSPEELTGRSWYDHFLPAMEGGDIRKIYDQAMLGKQAISQYKNVVVTRKGEEKTITWITEPTLDASGEIEGMMNFGIDSTEQENAFLQIQQMKAELEKENLLLRGEAIPEWMRQEIIGTSDAITYAIQKAKKVASTQATVLLEGETGVGKELFADLIQGLSLRSTKPFVKVNCGALPAELIEDELFGHEKGAFTGALNLKRGRMELAHEGTLFLDEIGDVDPSLQPKLLRALQEREFERLGSNRTIHVDVRLIAATNRDLGEEVKNGKFRDDLFYRLNVFPITIPALRHRKEDIPMLIQFFIEKKSRKHGRSFKNINKADLNFLNQYEWPGNIREMKNVIERAVINSESDTIRFDLFAPTVDSGGRLHAGASLEDLEKAHIIKVLVETNWRISGENGAAKRLSINPSTLRSRIKKLNIHKAP